ncbi:MAG TPA: orotidine-5'-phosphate decarboxylase [Candidatus Paceibacterota bacterium]|nr:orotidine-5'-phosphate decarboxylase [Candidatus Paceibacterota bacterium]
MKMLAAKTAERKLVCVGLDVDLYKIPQHIKNMYDGNIRVSYQFNKAIIDATKDLVSAYKPNLAFYMSMGIDGIATLQNICRYIKDNTPNVPIILDAKYGDIGNTNEHYAKFAFDYIGADAVTVHNYMGSEAMKPFLDRKDKGIIVLCKTSNGGSGEFQDLYVMIDTNQNKPMSEIVAATVFHKWNANGNCLLVVGATCPKELKAIREIVGDMGILSPGAGSQGGELEKVIENGLNSKGQGLIINSSRDVIYASSGKDFAEAARAKVIEMNNKIDISITKIVNHQLRFDNKD